MNFLEKISNEGNELEVIITLSILGVFIGAILIVLIITYQIFTKVSLSKSIALSSNFAQFLSILTLCSK